MRSNQAFEEAMKEMPWKGIVHSNATVANLIRKAEIRVLPAVVVVDKEVRSNHKVVPLYYYHQHYQLPHAWC